MTQRAKPKVVGLNKLLTQAEQKQCVSSGFIKQHIEDRNFKKEIQQFSQSFNRSI